MKSDLSSEVFEPLFQINNVNKAWLFLCNILTNCFDKHAPVITKRVKGTFAPWLSSEIKKLMNNRDKMLRKFRKTNDNNHWDEYKRLRNSSTAELRKAKSDYHQSLLTENRNNPRKFWQAIKSIFPSKKFRVGVPAESNLRKANAFCEFFSSIAMKLKHTTFKLREFIWNPPTVVKQRTQQTFQFGYVSTIFVERELKKLKRKKATGFDNLPPGLLKDAAAEIASPLAYIINLSLRSGQVPSQWKIAEVIPLHKSGSTDDNNNFRPISILPVVSKILEKAVHHQLMNYIEDNNLLSDNQFGYRSMRSTELATTLFTDFIRKSADNGLMTGAVFLDLSKAFDTLGHDRLLQKLKSYGIKGLALQWFTDYLFQRSQIVKLGQEHSSPCPLVCGVPQGSILGPVLFLLFFDDFSDCVHHCNVLQFADDTVIFISSKKVCDIEYLLNRDLNSISLYLKTNELVANLKKGKTESMLFGTAKRISSLPGDSRNLKLFFNDSPINFTDTLTHT